MKQFVPMTDEMLFDAAQFIGPLVPYQCGIAVAHGLREQRMEAVAPPPEVSAPPSMHRPA